MSPLRVGPSRCLGQGEARGQVMLRPDAPHGKHQTAAGEVGEGPFSEPPPATSHLCDSSRSSSIYRRPWGGSTIVRNGQGLLLQPLLPSSWASVTLTWPSRVRSGERWSARLWVPTSWALC